MILPPPPVLVTPPVPTRDAKGRWLPGVAPNPRGRPLVMGELRKFARSHTQAGLDRLVKIIEDDDQPGTTHIAAVSLLWAYGYGRPIQQVEVGKPGSFEEMDDIQLKQYAHHLYTKLIIGVKADE